MIVIDCIQGSPEWHAARSGKVTASRICDLVRRTKTGVSALRETYLGEIVAERLGGPQGEGFCSPAMQWGKDHEATARAMYEFLHDVTATCVGFIVHGEIAMAGASPDALVGEKGGLEIKCPNTKTHIEMLLGAAINPDYIKQCQWNMACAGRDWWDFVSFDPRLPSEMQLFVERIPRDQAMIDELERATRVFLDEVDGVIAKLLKKFPTLKEAA